MHLELIPSEPSDALRGHYHMNLKMLWRSRSSEFGDALLRRDYVDQGTFSMAVTMRT